jgi:flagellar hook assembly protein FlgD
VNLSVYNIAGQLVKTLVNERKNTGFYSVHWEASGVGSGLYFYRIEAGEYVETRKCVVLK